MLALLSCEPRLTRQRRWLQDKLWSDSDQSRGSGSLRSEIVKIRRSFGSAQDALIATKTTLSLDERLVEVIDDESLPGDDFLEGIDINDPEFEDWLTLMRSSRVAPGVAAPGLSRGEPVVVAAPEDEVIIVVKGDEGSRLRRIEVAFADMVCRSIRELFAFEARVAKAEDASPGGLRLLIEASEEDGDRIGIRVAVDRAASASPPWAETAVGPRPASAQLMSPQHLGLCHRATIALIDLLARAKPSARESLSADALAGSALGKMFTMRREHFEESDQLLLRAYEQQPRGLYQAWRAQLAVIRFVEAGLDSQVAREMSEEFCARAMADEPMNSNVLAAVANARLVFEQDGAAARELSMLSVKMNPANPLAWTSWTNALLYTGEPRKALTAAKTGQSLANEGKFRFWADFYVALASLATGEHQAATTFSERARALNPAFRPPLRYLIGLYSCNGDVDKARQTIQRLERIEPEFSIDRIISDDGYPVSMMRKNGLIDASRLRYAQDS